MLLNDVIFYFYFKQNCNLSTYFLKSLTQYFKKSRFPFRALSGADTETNIAK